MKSKILLYLSLISFLSYVGYYTYERFEAKPFLDPIKRVGNAVSIESALLDLTTAINIVEARGLTKGSTSIIGIPRPTEDVSLFFEKLKLCKEILKKASAENATNYQKKETLLLVHCALGMKKPYPSGIWIYPHNKIIALWGLVSLIFLVIIGDYNYHHQSLPLQKRKN